MERVIKSRADNSCWCVKFTYGSNLNLTHLVKQVKYFKTNTIHLN
jgi:hypothetical protein